MKITEKKNYKILRASNGNLPEFVDELTTKHSDLKKYNLVIDLLDHKNLDTDQLLMFLEIATIQFSQKKSFVIVTNNIDIEKVPEDIIVVPSLREAEDVINMDEMQRELGI